MALLRLLESIRFPALDKFMSVITYLGDETAFIAIALLVFWCLNKRYGYFLFLVNVSATVVMQILKLLVRTPRPWVRDPGFTIVEAAREAAAGYSFPSGHTSCVTGTLGVIAVTSERKWLRRVCGGLILLVAFSRMYLGVHYFSDVIVGFLIGAFFVLLFLHLFTSDERFAARGLWMLPIMIVSSCIFLAFVKLWPFPAGVTAEHLAGGTKNAYSLAGTVIGLAVVYLFDSSYLKFETGAPFLGQVLKYVLGLAIMLGLKTGLKSLLLAVGFTGPIQNTIRYFVITVFAGCIWPLSFPLLARVGKRKQPPVTETPAGAEVKKGEVR